MIKISSPISIFELGSTHVDLSIYDKSILNQNLFYEEKLDYTSNKKSTNAFKIDKLILKAEKDIGKHLNEALLLVDSSTIFSLDFSIKKNFEKKIINKNDLDYLLIESEKTIKSNYQDKVILHKIEMDIYIDNKKIENINKLNIEANNVVLEVKFIMIEKKIFENLKNIFFKNHISLIDTFCTTYIKSLGFVNKNNISEKTAFIDIGFSKSSLAIFKNQKLLYLNNIHIGGDHITKDISKVLKLDYRKAEAWKKKFSKNKQFVGDSDSQNNLKQIINSRLEEIIELLFFNCPLINNKNFETGLKLIFTGNGSRVLNENLLSFGPEFSFIKDMSIFDDERRETCDSALRFSLKNEVTESQKSPLNLDNKGFFEKLFEYFTSK